MTGPIPAAPWPTALSSLELDAAVGARGGTVLLTGGSVRDALLGHGEPDDLDLLVFLPVAEAAPLLAGLGWRASRHPFRDDTVFAAPPGESHLSLSFVGPWQPQTLVGDALGRDFTCNALYATAEGEVIDPLGRGVADLAARRVLPTVPDSFAQDPVRLLRHPRMRARVGDAVAPAGELLDAMRAAAPLLRATPPVRPMRELHKLMEGLGAEAALDAAACLRECGALEALLPEADIDLLGEFLHACPCPDVEGHDARVLVAVLGLRPDGAGPPAFDDRHLRWGDRRDRLLAEICAAYGGPDAPGTMAPLLFPEACGALTELGRSRNRERRGASVPAASRTMFRP